MTESTSSENKDDDEFGLRDGRRPGDSDTKFTGPERNQIVIESAFLFLVIVGGLTGLASILWCISNLQFGVQNPTTCVTSEFCTLCKSPLIMTSAFFCAGLIGGSVFSLKWLYHSVANDLWHKDRFLWRVSVPLMGGVLGVFVTYLFARTLGTSFSPTSFKVEFVLPACGFSFLVGIFADGAIASLEKLARSIFGTLENFNGSK